MLTTLTFHIKLTFSKEVNSSLVTTQSISNLGTGGSTNLAWAIQDCGDNKNFKIEPTAIVGDGTIIPDVSNIISAVNSLGTTFNLENSLNLATVNFDTVDPSVTINQSTLENIGSCSFSNTDTFENDPGFSFKVTFSEKINNSSFTLADITNTGTGGASTLIWSLASCGDDQNYKLTTTTISGEGTVIPQILASSVTDPAGNFNTLSTFNGAVTYELAGWRQEAYIKAINRGGADFYGRTVSISGDTIVVGAYNEGSDTTTIVSGSGFTYTDSASGSGAVYVYRNNARLFPVTDVFPVITSNSIALKWNKTGGAAAGYGVNIEFGIVTPTLCSVSMDYDLGDNNEVVINSLTGSTDYSLRICVYDSSNQFLEDKVIHLRTNPEEVPL